MICLIWHTTNILRFWSNSLFNWENTDWRSILPNLSSEHLKWATWGFQLMPKGITQWFAWSETVSRSMQLLQRTCLELCLDHGSSECLDMEGLPMEDRANATQSQQSFPRVTNNYHPKAAILSRRWLMFSSLMPVKGMPRSPGSTWPSSLSSNQMVNFNSSATSAKNWKVMRKWKCQLQFGLWNITLYIYEEKCFVHWQQTSSLSGLCSCKNLEHNAKSHEYL